MWPVQHMPGRALKALFFFYLDNRGPGLLGFTLVSVINLLLPFLCVENHDFIVRIIWTLPCSSYHHIFPRDIILSFLDVLQAVLPRKKMHIMGNLIVEKKNPVQAGALAEDLVGTDSVGYGRRRWPTLAGRRWRNSGLAAPTSHCNCVWTATSKKDTEINWDGTGHILCTRG